jgi:hypothetical protein
MLRQSRHTREHQGHHHAAQRGLPDAALQHPCDEEARERRQRRGERRERDGLQGIVVLRARSACSRIIASRGTSSPGPPYTALAGPPESPLRSCGALTARVRLESRRNRR